MPSKIETYIAAKQEHSACMDWAQLIGKRYFVGDGGVGALATLKLSTLPESLPAILYPQNNGGQNYHTVPIQLVPYLEAAILAKSTEIISMAVAALEKDLQTAAQAALEEHTALMQEAGLGP